MEEWSIGVNKDGELFILKNGEPIVAFTSDYTLELYMALHSFYTQTLS
jgi:hypothetical protein